MTDLCYLSALELRDHFVRRTLSPVEVTAVLLDRIAGVNPALNAFVTVTVERALAQARKAEALYAAGNAPPLAGIPFSLKDLTPTKGIRTARGSLLYENWIPNFDVPLTERLYKAGAVLLGKTNTPEFGWKGDSGNRLFGPSHNPWQHGRTSGGSSGT
jgi:Asp-tRNA(Asn)/Glu-tRNA(Gln) amidotransferase A subunit family amidase